MASSSERLADLRKRAKEYEQIIASFESMNGNLRLRRTNASPEIKAYCTRHLEQNTRSIEAMKRSLAHMVQQIADETR